MNRQHIRNVQEFHEKFGVPIGAQPRQLNPEDMAYRLQFLREELDEFEAAYKENDLAKQADALIDLEYVLHGTALWMGLGMIWGAMHRRVHNANMAKIAVAKADDTATKSGRANAFDVVKPAGWAPPDLQPLIDNWHEHYQGGD